ncbi:importin-9-like [Tropilaelaps mercedesae]|uniref:Importin-9-like n=1 Tax=Tropilaelaps mercedesae TaxID=418985 RepID=A0A1V9Y2A1_9ACAR|nr:importin-9-like [Tropilaelaps mercedesae]
MGGGTAVEMHQRQALVETLCQLQSADSTIRIQAEGKAKALEVTDAFAVHLCEIILDPSSDFASRQLGSLLLKQYVDFHWSKESDKFTPPECPAETKERVRQMLPLGLKEAHNKLRGSIAYAISTIAHFDWPEQWGQLFGILMQALKSNEVHAIDGTMKVLVEFTRDVTDSQMVNMVPVVLPEIYNLLIAPSSPLKVKLRAVQVLVSMAALDKSVFKTHLSPFLPKFMKAFVDILNIPQAQTFHPVLKTEILNTLKELAKARDKGMQPFLGEILGPVWSTLTDTAKLYTKNQVNNSEDIEEDVDSDGEVYGVQSLVLAIFEFVQALIESAKLQDPVHKGMEDLLYYLIVYMQITNEQIQNWLADPDKFAEEEDEDTFAYGVRILSLDVLQTLKAEFYDDCVLPACGAVTRHLRESQQAMAAGDPNWWKLHESSMFALQAMSELLTEKFKQNQMPPDFNLTQMLETLVVEDMNLPGANPFLVGRCLCFAAKYASCMQQPVIQSFLNTTLTALQPAQPAVLRISAARALQHFCDYLKVNGGRTLLQPYLGPFIEALNTMATEATPEALSIVLEALVLLVSMDPEFTALAEAKVTPLTIGVFLKHSNDNVLVSLAQEIFKELSKVPACSVQLQQKLLPTLIEILTTPQVKMPTSMPAVALDILATFVRHSPAPLPDMIITQAFPACVACVVSTDDITCMQNGGECLRAYVFAAYPQLAQWRSDQGQTGVHLVLQVCEHLLDPKAPESAAAFVGRLVCTLVARGMPDLGQEGVERLLRAVLSKLLHTETCSVAQNLILVFARLVHTDLSALLDFLSSVPGPSGESALAFVLAEWCNKQHLFFGLHDTKVTLLALTKLVEHALNKNDERILGISVKGDEIVDLNDVGTKTRAQRAKKPTQWTEIPVVVKMYKLILRELIHQSEDAWEEESETDSENEDIAQDRRTVSITIHSN